jgi:hypothetical protein
VPFEVISKLHDVELCSFSIIRKERKIILGFLMSNGTIERLQFEGVKSFRANDLILQNVVSRVLLSPDESVPDETLLYWIKWVNTLSDSDVFINNSEANEYLAMIKARSLSIFILEPSWGAELVVIFEKVNRLTAA